MAPKGTKRTQAAKADKAPKRAKLSPEEEQLQRVVVAIQGAEKLPPSVRDLLVVAAEGSLNVVKDVRHTSQERVVGMIEEALADMRAEKEAAVASEAEVVKDAEASLASKQAAQQEAEATLAGKTEAVKAAEEKVAEQAASLTEVMRAAKAAEAALQAAKQAQAAKEEESNTFEEALKGPLAQLMEGSWEEEAQAQQQMEALGPFIAQLQLDESLRTSLPAAFLKKMSSRGSFDCLVLQQAQKAFSDKSSELRAAFAACAPAVEEAEAAGASAQQALEAAQATAASLTAALAEAKGEESESAAASKAAAQEVKSFTAELKKISKGHSVALAELELVQGPIADFESLRDRTAKVAEAAAEVVAEGAPAEGGA